MSTIVIEKYVGESCVEKLELPVLPLKFLAKLLPKQALRELERHGLDVEALLNGHAPDTGAHWLEVEEEKVLKRVRVSRRD